MNAKKKQLGLAAFTPKGRALAEKIKEFLKEEYEISGYESHLSDWCRQCFEQRFAAIVFVGACGIAVRQIAPFLKSKTEDPAVVVLDEGGKHVISLLSGHLGGANELTHMLAERLGADPVITTATDVNHLPAVDVIAKQNQLQIGSMKAAKKVSAALLRKERVFWYCEGRMEGRLPDGFVPLEGPVCSGSSASAAEKSGALESARVICCVAEKIPSWLADWEKKGEERVLLALYPKNLVLGIGCRRGKSAEEIRAVAEKVLSQADVSQEKLCAVTSIDLKKDEEGISRLCREWNLPFFTYSAQRLRQVSGQFSSSEFVAKTTGVDNVCERAALAFCETDGGGTIMAKKYAKNGVTAALAVREWRVRFE